MAALLKALPASMERLQWSAERLSAERTSRLRTLIGDAQTHAPWHRERLRDVNPSTISEEELAETVPVMTKAEMMDNFEDVLTDRRLTREKVEHHLDSLQGDAYLLDEYHVVATGGSSGRRSVLVWDWDGWTECFLSLGRRSLARLLRHHDRERHGGPERTKGLTHVGGHPPDVLQPADRHASGSGAAAAAD